MRATSAEKGAYPSPTRKLSFGQSHVAGFGSPDRSAAPDQADQNASGNSREIREMLKELDTGIHDKLSLIKMLIIKCSDADSAYKKIKQALNKGDVNQAEK